MKRTLTILLSTGLVLFAFAEKANAVYNSETGRFMQQDPLGTVPEGYGNKFNFVEQNTDGVNSYVYVRNNPTVYVDSTGLVCGVTIYRQKFDGKYIAKGGVAGDIDNDGTSDGDPTKGREWIEWNGGSFGWYPVEDGDARGLYSGQEGYLQNPDEKEGKIWTILQPTAWDHSPNKSIGHGPKAGISCECIDKCEDINECISSLLNKNIHGTWGGGGLNAVLMAEGGICGQPGPAYENSETEFKINRGHCRDFVNYVLETCCLKKTSFWKEYVNGKPEWQNVGYPRQK